MNTNKSNSYKYRANKAEPEERKVEKVVSGSVKTKKKGELTKFRDVFISEDASSVKSYIFADVFIPALKKLVSDIVKDGIEMILYGSTGNRSRSGSSSRVSYVSYSDNKRDDRRPDVSARNRFDFEDIEFDKRGDAEVVLRQMDEMVERFGYVTVADMYDMAGLVAPHTANKYGWTSLRTAEIARARSGSYIIKTPRIALIDY